MTKDIIGRGWSFPPQIDALGGIRLTTAEEEIQQSIRIILSTAPGERVMRPAFGSRLHELVFEPNNEETFAQARRIVREALGMWEPRINLTNVFVSHSAGGSVLLITLEYEIKSTRDLRTLVYPFYLIPEE
ncbi:MAG: GPW/gp25 family protein [Caldilineaceae bacterium]